MILSKEVKQKIKNILDSDEFKSDLYEGLDQKKREELGQFYTPADICIQMIEKFSYDTLAEKNIIDPTCGSGNLLIACLIAGADPEAIYGNEYDSVAVDLCKKRINRCCDILNIPHIKNWQIHQGNALQKRCLTEFSAIYDRNYNAKDYIDDLEYAQCKDKNGQRLSWEEENKQAANRHNIESNQEVINTKYDSDLDIYRQREQELLADMKRQQQKVKDGKDSSVNSGGEPQKLF